MCNAACIRFAETCVREEEVKGKQVVEVGARNINGSFRPIIERFQPLRYLGVDLVEGPGVDEICDIADLADYCGRESFDLVVSTELLEHVYDWRKAVANLKAVLKPLGVLIITTRSRGFRYHGFPSDFWRYGIDDMRAIFSDLIITAIEKDPLSPGVFIKAVKPAHFVENSLGSHRLYSIIAKSRRREVGEFERRIFMGYRRLRHSLGGALKKRPAARP
jgi:SAM-dependent methyltransferase